MVNTRTAHRFQSTLPRGERLPKLGDFRPHDLRHRRVTTWLAGEKNPVHVKEAMGHSTAQIVAILEAHHEGSSSPVASRDRVDMVIRDAEKLVSLAEALLAQRELSADEVRHLLERHTGRDDLL